MEARVMIQFSSVQLLSQVQIFATPWLQHARPPCTSPTPRACSNSCPSSQWCHPTISSSIIPFSSCLQSFPASRSFPMSQLFTSGGQSIGVSASTSVLLRNTQDWFPLGWTGWISLQPKGLSRIFSRGRSQDGGGIGQGDHFLSYKFIQRTKFTKELLIASSGHQARRKAAHCLRREVGQNIKDKKGDKRARDGDPSREGSLNRGSFQSPGNPRTGRSEGSFQISEGNLTGRRN